MIQHKLKLIVVTDSTKVILYEAEGLKIKNMVETFEFGHPHHHHNKEQGMFQKGTGPASLYEPHTSEEELKYADAAKELTSFLEEIVEQNSDYKELIIVAEPRMLGAVRHHLSNNLKKMVTKEIVKDLVHYDKHRIEQTVFAS